jgi:hypothetical protein
MKRFRIILAVILLSAPIAHADDITTYADVAGTSCALTNVPVGPPGFSVYVIHKFNGGAGAAQFKVNDTTGFFATSQTTIAGLALGAWNIDWSIAYGAACLTGDLHIATLNFLYFGGTTFTCQNSLETMPAPTSPVPGEIAIVNCAGGFEAATGGVLNFGPGSDACDPTFCGVNPVAEKTWGGIKALYR